MSNDQDKIDLYEFEKNRFRDLLEEDEAYVYKRYGFTLLYSLSAEETFDLRRKMGWEEKEALDYYNLGVKEALNENYKEAMKFFKKAESMECNRPELFFNIGLIHETEGNTKETITYYQKYVDASEQWDEIPRSLHTELDEVRNHIKELKEETSS
ncbi:hypothetical protein GF373_13410 [bacterium]|nr:hypothetical protein [bacterium]